MEAHVVKNKEKQQKNNNQESGLSLGLLEDKVVMLIQLVHSLKAEKAELEHKNLELQYQITALEAALVSETKDLEQLSQEKLSAKVFVDNLLHSIDSLIEVKEQ